MHFRKLVGYVIKIGEAMVKEPTEPPILTGHLKDAQIWDSEPRTRAQTYKNRMPKEEVGVYAVELRKVN